MKTVYSLICYLLLVSLFSCAQPNTNAQQNKKDSINTYNSPEVEKELSYIEHNMEKLNQNPQGKIFITGSTAGIGMLAAKTLIAKGYKVVVHAKDNKRAEDVKRDLPGIEAVVIGDLSSIEETKQLATQVNALGTFDAVIYNAGVYEAAGNVIYHVNSLAPYILTCLINKPKRIIYISSDMHLSGNLKLDELSKSSPSISYSDSKLQLLTLSMAFAKKWPDVYINAVHPGWVPTKMGGSGAPDDLRKGYETQVWLAEGKEPNTHISGHYFFHQQDANFNEIAKDTIAQDQLLKAFEKATGVSFPN